jgi:hypothetical protein
MTTTVARRRNMRVSNSLEPPGPEGGSMTFPVARPSRKLCAKDTSNQQISPHPVSSAPVGLSRPRSVRPRSLSDKRDGRGLQRLGTESWHGARIERLGHIIGHGNVAR